MMRSALATAILLLAAGCLGPGDGPEPLRDATAGVYQADERGLTPLSREEFGVSSVDPFVATVDLIPFLAQDTAILLLYQALDAQVLELDVDQSVEIEPDRAGTDEGEGSSFCLFGMLEANVPGDAYIERAAGREAPMEETGYDRDFVWTSMGGSDGGLPVSLFGSFGFGGGRSMTAVMERGDWVLAATAQSGVDATDLNNGENRMQTNFTADGAGRLVVLPTVPFFCGSGFARFGGTTAGGVAIGGHLATSGPFGTTAAFSPDSLLPEDLADNRATLTFLDESMPLTDLTSEWRFAYQAGDAELEVGQWTGSPTWLLAGFSIPVPAPGCPDHCPPR